eukprot:8285115-Pyramimonas_sp.AAC.1
MEGGREAKGGGGLGPRRRRRRSGKTSRVSFFGGELASRARPRMCRTPITHACMSDQRRPYTPVQHGVKHVGDCAQQYCIA